MRCDQYDGAYCFVYAQIQRPSPSRPYPTAHSRCLAYLLDVRLTRGVARSGPLRTCSRSRSIMVDCSFPNSFTVQFLRLDMGRISHGYTLPFSVFRTSRRDLDDRRDIPSYSTPSTGTRSVEIAHCFHRPWSSGPRCSSVDRQGAGKQRNIEARDVTYQCGFHALWWTWHRWQYRQ